MNAPELYRDEHLLVVNKPAGVATQADKHGEPGLYETLRHTDELLALHHRLDRPASGLVLFGRSRAANKPLTTAFREHQIVRTYLAVLVGNDSDGSWTFALDGKSARSDVEVIGSDSGFVAVKLNLHTGRTHQLRRHAAMAGSPIAGDRRYGGHASRAWPRLALHAHRLTLKHPVTGAPLDLVAPLPDDLEPLWMLAGGGALSP